MMRAPEPGGAAHAAAWLRARYGRDVLAPLGRQPRADLAHRTYTWLGAEYGRDVLAPLGAGASALFATIYAIDAWGRASALNRTRLVCALDSLWGVLQVYNSGPLRGIVAERILGKEDAAILSSAIPRPAPSPRGSGHPTLAASVYAIQAWGRGDRANKARAVAALRSLALVMQSYGCANRIRAVIPCVLDWGFRAELWPLIAPADDDGRTLAPLPEHEGSEGPR